VIAPSLLDWCSTRLAAPAQPFFAYKGQGQDPLARLAVIVPSYRRQDFLLRQLVYWHGVPVELYLLDGSPEPIPGLVEALQSRADRHYVHNPANLLQRLADVAPRLERPFAVLLGDDEFHLPRGLRNAVQALEALPDHAGCIGQSLRFFLSADCERVAYGRGYAHLGYRADQDDLRRRLLHAMSDYNAATCYAVLTREAWRRSWGRLLKTSCKDTCEVQQAVATYLAGKFTTVDEVYWLRSDENVSVSDADVFGNLSFSDWWHGKGYAAERQDLLALLAGQAADGTGIGANEARAAVLAGVAAFDDFYRSAHRPASALSPAKLKGYLAGALRRLLPAALYRRMRSSVRRESDPLARADLGARDRLAEPSCRGLFHFDAVTAAELLHVETLLREFYRQLAGHPRAGAAELKGAV
jgi:glycosyltransferase domain-containing protein